MSKLDLLTANDAQGKYPPTQYAASVDIPALNSALEGDIRADICVIGGGFTGLSAALNLAQFGYDVVLLEAQRLGFGASGRNGGQIGTRQRASQDELEAKYGFDHAKAMFDISIAAHDYVLKLCSDYAIDIGYQRGVAHTVFNSREMRHEHEYAMKLSRDYGYDKLEILGAEEMRERVASPKYHGGVIDWGAGHGHPLALALGMAKAAKKAGVRIYENSRVIALDGVARSERGSVKAEHYVLACNGYLGDLHKETARYVMPINNFIVATEPLGVERAAMLIPQNIAVADSKFVVNYFRRSPDHRLLFGGGESYGYLFPRDLAAKAYQPMVDIFPQLRGVKIDYAWGGTLAITMNRLPYVRRKGNHWISSGYSGHGVALASYMGHLLAQAIKGNCPEFDAMQKINHRAFPGGKALRHPILIAAMLWYQLRDKIGF